MSMGRAFQNRWLEGLLVGLSSGAILALAAIVAPAFGTLRPNYRCSTTVTHGCFSSYACTPTTDSCQTGSIARSKKGDAVDFRVCASAAGFSCDESTMTCFVETYYSDASCANACKIVTNTVEACQ